MHSVAFIFMSSLVICVTANNGHQPIDHNFINIFDASDINQVNYRLPNNTIPEHYEISLETKIHQQNFTFTGSVRIKLLALEATKNITIHARQLIIKEKQYFLTADDIPMPMDVQMSVDRTTEFLIFNVPNGLEKGKRYQLLIFYTGELRSDMAGFYRSSYVNSKKETRWLATTQFEQTDARHAFPCYDEPSLKATFDINIKHGDTYHAVSNMKIKSVEPTTEQGMVKTTFDRTPVMSTYLVAFIVSDYKNSTVNASATNPTQQSIFAPAEMLSQAQYGLVEGVALLNAIEKYLNVPYGLTKMDQAAIPNFKAGAMENWGLVTYRYENLLYDPSIHTVQRQLSSTTTVSHEYGHQWFGNLVSPVWWSYIWLNEGFATVFENLGTDLVHPKWEIWSYFVTAKLQPVLRVDAQNGTRPMTYYVESPAAVSALFDNIAYTKAGSVIRMFMHALGEETFKKGLKNYLNKYNHSAADENALFEHLNQAAHEDKAIPDSWNVGNLFGSWSNQKGFPVLTVTRNQNGSITLRQEKYSAYAASETEKSSWWIPFNLASAQNAVFDRTRPNGWLTSGEQTKLLLNASEGSEIKWNDDDWVILNRQQTGYYRIQYDDKNYDLIMKELNGGNLNKIHSINRAQIIDDLHEFVVRERVSAKHLCSAINYLSKEKAYAPWQAANKILDDWHRNFQTSNKLKSFQSLVGKSVAPYYDHLTINEADDEPILNKLARKIAINLACEHGVPKCLQNTYSQFKEIINGRKVKPNSRLAAIFNGIRSASDDEISKLWSLFLNNEDKEERQEILSSLGNIARKATLNEYLRKSIAEFNGKTVDGAERAKIITTIAGRSQNGLTLAIQFLATELENVQKMTGLLANIIRTIAPNILTVETDTKFSELTELAKQKGLLTENDAHSIRSAIDEKLKWQKEKLKKIESDFFTGKCDSGAMKLIAFPITVISILFSILRWYLM